MDRLTPERRSENMRRIKSKGMKPEMVVRKLVHRMGYRYRLHHKGLPGKPDLVFAGRKRVIFVHGCFWHQHDDPECRDGRMPRSNAEYWKSKLERNLSRDNSAVDELRRSGWQVLVVWECETREVSLLEKRVYDFMS